MKLDQIIAIVFIAILIVNMVVFAMKLISVSIFWLIMGLSFIVSYAIKKMNEKDGKRH